MHLTDQTVNIFIMLQKTSISNKCCFLNFKYIKESWKMSQKKSYLKKYYFYCIFDQINAASILKIPILCSMEGRKSYRIGMTWGWVNAASDWLSIEKQSKQTS